MSVSTLPKIVHFRHNAGPFELHKRGWWNSHNLSVWICCPGCGHIGLLSMHHHSISKEGVVTPAVECCNCNFQKMIVLDDWSFGAWRQ